MKGGECPIREAREYAAWAIGARITGRVMVALFSAPGIGAFALQTAAAAAIARRFENPRLFGLVAGADDARRFVVACNPHIDGAVEADAAAPMTVPVDWFDNGLFAPVRCPDPSWRDRTLTDPALVLLPPMLGDDAALVSVLAEAPPRFRLPTADERALLDAVASRGLDPRRWLAALMVDDPAPYEPLARHIAAEQGGQVIRLGGAAAAPMTTGAGIVDLAGADVPFAVRAAALSRARYAIADGSAPSALASAFAVPCALTNAVDTTNRVWRPEDVVLAKRVVDAGAVLGTADAHRRGLLRPEAPADIRRMDNTDEDLVAVADHMAAGTAGCRGWREPAPEARVEPMAAVPFPLARLPAPPYRFWD